MRTNSLIIIIILGFVALWLTTGVTEYNGTVSGLDGSSRLAAGGIAGPQPWAPALLNAQAVAAGSPCRVPYDWTPADSPNPPCITEPPYTPPPSSGKIPLSARDINKHVRPYGYPKSDPPVQEKASN